MDKALNIIGAQHVPMNKRAEFITDYVRDNSDDRRYTLKFLAAS